MHTYSWQQCLNIGKTHRVVLTIPPGHRSSHLNGDWGATNTGPTLTAPARYSQISALSIMAETMVRFCPVFSSFKMRTWERLITNQVID